MLVLVCIAGFFVIRAKQGGSDLKEKSFVEDAKQVQSIMKTPLQEKVSVVNPAPAREADVKVKPSRKKPVSQEDVKSAGEENNAEKAVVTRPGVPVAVSENSLSEPVKPNVPAAGEAKRQSFTIQVCTYRTEADAQKLTDRLKAMDLSARYEIAGSQSGESRRFYIVMIGKENTYEEAQTKLDAFKKLPVAVEFSDAYIRKA